MFHELYELVNGSVGEVLKQNTSIPSNKHGAVIAETTSGLVRVFSQLNTKSNSLRYDDPRFSEMAFNQLRWRMTLHLGLTSITADQLIDQLLPVLIRQLQNKSLPGVVPDC